MRETLGQHMTKTQFLEKAEAISRQANVLGGQHRYFKQHENRLYRTSELFGLFSGRLGDVLEIGPFFGYTPFMLRERADSYTVLEGDDPAVYPLVPFYHEFSIAFSHIDFFEVFGPTRNATHKLPGADGAYDTVLCWETMEHFNFNPVKFVRELHRVLKPAGRVCITVPNRASFPSICALLSGRNEAEMVNSFFEFEDYEANGKKAFYGFHWHEYTPREMASLFRQAGFRVQVCKTFTVFQDHEALGFARRLARGLARTVSRVFNRFGTNVYLVATREGGASPPPSDGNP